MRKLTEKYDLDFCKKYAFDFGYKILDDRYVNCKSNMTFLHIYCGNSFPMDWEHFNLRGQRCPKCAEEKRHDKQKLGLSFCIEEASKRNYTILSERYENNQKNLIFRHDENNCFHIFNMSWGNFSSGQTCPKCSGNEKLKIERLKIISMERGYELLDNEYVNSFTYMEFKHIKCGNIYKAVWNNFRCGKGCPYCNTSKGEERVLNYLESIGFRTGVDLYREKSFSDCRYIYPLSFDFYIPNNNIIIEYQGEQHYFPVDFAGKGKKWAEKEFKKNMEKDKIKRKYCEKNNIYLLEIRYDDDVENILKKYLL